MKKQIFLQAFEDITKQINGENEIFSLGFSDLDMMLGNTKNGSLITIGGRPSIGKTALAICFCTNLLEQNKKVIYFSLEASDYSLATRMIVNKSEVDLQKFRLKLTSEDDLEKLKQAAEFFDEKSFMIEDKTNLIVEDVIKLATETDADCIFIDYIQLMYMERLENSAVELNLAVKRLKDFALQSGKNIFIITQLSRAVERRSTRIPQISDIREVCALEELSDVILLIYNDSYYNREIAEHKDKAEIILAKNKLGPVGSFDIKYTNGIFKDGLVTDLF